MSALPLDELWTEAEAAARLRMSERTLRELRRVGKIRYVALTTRKIFYRPEDCAEYLEACVKLNDNAPTRPMPKRQPRRAGAIVPFSQQVR